jgi:hypothetical protein
MILFFGLMTTGLLYLAYSLYVDVDASGASATTNYLPYLLCSSPSCSRWAGRANVYNPKRALRSLPADSTIKSSARLSGAIYWREYSRSQL